MNWPRGKYNNARICGFRVVLIVDILYWKFWPRFRWDFGTQMIHWLCFRFRMEAEYDFLGGQNYDQQKDHQARDSYPQHPRF